ncbi:hypothetical protein [Nostoc sp.]
MSIASCNLSSLIEELGVVKEEQQPATVELDVASYDFCAGDY